MAVGGQKTFGKKRIAFVAVWCVFTTRPESPGPGSSDMRCIPARLAALAIALFCSAAVYAQGQGLQLPRSSPDRDKTAALPTILDADRIEGVAGKDTRAQGNAILRRGDLSIRADSLIYHEENEDVEARGNVRLQRNGDRLSGPSLTYSLRDA